MPIEEAEHVALDGLISATLMWKTLMGLGFADVVSNEVVVTNFVIGFWLMAASVQSGVVRTLPEQVSSLVAEYH